ncbi:Flp pilus assembly protein CpaB [Sphingomonas koreensis]|jgi:pilus assembly protein CpaB|uniref:Flp pilus assembly protein CpaB n=1 Tax=Sphingomonas koreensis TaxID=93064 RepID=A0A1L6JET7_9SPHN|nr:Flp pilus assembly protein CpaB [Sphingomonas koreensis]APR54442.1 Flp pilus assembly protein CpaB [Sphingomonas koreensis]MDC7809477.1 Flp pilus assembly protein CpaB [Sphingomonas koreensis]PJI89923.1 pilus assembly protein CpaB [Sphingomonas koreensis]RSU20588.1 Flp pilus assembly protein CpaB [Sphingomonas koreensis]RSU28716.1 Flp pilus assembly protein CpaB [Sphingomonas koreensis]
MDGRKIILLVGALIIAAVTAFMARTLMVGTPAPVADAAPNAGGPPPIQGVEVLVATKALPVGTILGPESIKFVPWPEELVEGAYYRKADTDLKALQGTVVRFAVPAGQPITQGGLVKPGDRGFLAAALGPGMRAVTVPVSAQSAVAGFVFPGDRVDLLLTQTVAGGGDGPPLKASETVLRNLRVLATDQKTDKQTDESGNTVVTTYSTVTVEATPRIAEKIAVAQTLGSLSLSLRSIADNNGELEEAIAAGDVSVPEGNDPKAEKAMLARVAARPVEGRSTFSTGADVSRFQRSSVPGRPVERGGTGASGGAYPGAAPKGEGPVVKIARGNSVTVVPVGGKN